MVVQREEYLKFLMDWKDQQIIKVISGIRRCGKSTLFELFRDKLLQDGVEMNRSYLSTLKMRITRKCVSTKSSMTTLKEECSQIR